MGYVRIQDISSIIFDFKLDPIDVVKDNPKRNPWRVLTIDKAETGSKNIYYGGDDNGSDNGDTEVEPILKEFQFLQVAQWQAHRDVIKSVKYIVQTDIPIIFTASMDRMAKIWFLNKDKIEPLGVLRQGYMLKQNYIWKFPLSNYDNDLDKR